MGNKTIVRKISWEDTLPRFKVNQSEYFSVEDGISISGARTATSRIKKTKGIVFTVSENRQHNGFTITRIK